MANALSWFEIPVRDIDRAMAFYTTVLGKTLYREDQPNGPTAVIPYERGSQDVSGAIVQAEHYVPSEEGAMLYLWVADTLDAALARVPGAGGMVLGDAIRIPQGVLAYIRDTEGNKIGLFSR